MEKYKFENKTLTFLECLKFPANYKRIGAPN